MGSGRVGPKMRIHKRIFVSLILVLGVITSPGCSTSDEDGPSREPPGSTTSSTAPSAGTADGSATTMCVDSLLPGRAHLSLGTVVRVQSRLADAQSRVSEALESAGAPKSPPFVPMSPAAGCPHGTPVLEAPTDGSLLRDHPIRPPVQTASPYTLKLFVLSDAEAQALFPGKQYLRMPYERICNERGGSCQTVSIALLIGDADATNEAVILEAIVDGLGMKQVFDGLGPLATASVGP